MYKLRIKIFLGLIGLFLLVIVARLGYLQIIRAEHYRSQAQKLLEVTQFLPAARGNIFDRNKSILATDQSCYDFCLDYRLLTVDEKWISVAQREKAKKLPPEAKWIRDEQLKIKRDESVSSAEAEDIFRQRWQFSWALARKLCEVYEKDFDLRISRIIQRVTKLHEYFKKRGIERIAEENQSHVIVAGLSSAAAVELKAMLHKTVGATIRPSHKRIYPYQSAACHIIGLTDRIYAEEIDKLNDEVSAQHNIADGAASNFKRKLHYYWPDDVVGKTGVEKMCEQMLRGERGFVNFKRTGAIIRNHDAKVGQDVQLTLDIDLQIELAKIFINLTGGKNGSLVVLSVPENEILAMVSIPTYDLNLYKEDFQWLANDSVDFSLRNRAISQLYPPGSTVKPLAALVGLSEGVIGVDTQITCNGYLHNPNSFRCWIYKQSGGSHGPLDLVNGIKKSCNIFFYNVGEWLQRKQPELLCDWFRQFGFENLPGIGIGEEIRGKLPDKFENIGESRMLAMGQGPIAVTPLHVANAMATIARDGEFRTAKLVQNDIQQQTLRQLDIPKQYFDVVKRGMFEVTRPGGTAHKYIYGRAAERPLPEHWEICGKTGTAKVNSLRVDTDSDGVVDVVRSEDMAWFAGFAPYRNPKIAFAIVVDYAGSGPKNAAPIGRELIRKCEEFGYLGFD